MFEWIIQNLVNFVPPWVWPFLVGVSAAAYVISLAVTKLPIASRYRYILLSLTAAACLASTFMFGAAGVATIYKNNVKELENKVKLAEEKSQNVNTQIETVIQYKTLIVKQFQTEVNKAIETNKVEINAGCKLSDASIAMYNRAVAGNQLELAK